MCPPRPRQTAKIIHSLIQRDLILSAANILYQDGILRLGFLRLRVSVRSERSDSEVEERSGRAGE